MAQYRELAAFAQFSSDLDDATRKQLDHGEKVTELMKQKQYSPMSVAEQAIAIFAAEKGYLNEIPLASIGEFEAELMAFAKSSQAELLSSINASGNYNDEIETNLHNLLKTFMDTQSF